MDLFPDLNPAQRQAVSHPGGPLLILAGAGSGKTRVITCRLAALVRRGVDPRRILAVTFTNKAAGEMRERTAKLLSGQADGMWIGTFHSICARLLRRYGERLGLPRDFVVFDDADQMQLVGQVLRELDLVSQVANPRAMLSAIDRAKNHGKGPQDCRGDFFMDIVGRVYERYQQRLREMSAVDFGDLLLLPLRLAAEDPQSHDALVRLFDHVLVDEFQDVNQVQYSLLRLLAGRSRQLVVVGDDDQAIYAWRGADVKIILRFQSDWPDAAVVRLEQNYRSTQVILQAANAVIARNRDRHHKTLFSEQQGGRPVVIYTAENERREADFVAQTIRRLCQEEGREPAEFAVCYRTNAQSRVLEEALRANGLAYTVVGGVRFYDRAEVKDVLCYLRLCHNPADEVALRRVINVPSRGIGDATLDKLEARARAGGVTLWQALQDALHGDVTLLGTAPRRRLQAFVTLVEDLQRVRQQESLADLTAAVLERSGYLEHLSADEGPESQARRENVMEFAGSIRERVEASAASGVPLTLTDYLEQIALASSVDTESRGVALMTVHAAKGLEFPVVLVTGLEDGLFPSRRRRSEDDSTEDGEAEERRLAYVAITRARSRLYLTHALTRRLYGQLPKVAAPSPFLLDLPTGCVVRQGVRGGPGTLASSAFGGAGRLVDGFGGLGGDSAGEVGEGYRPPRVATQVVDETAGVRVEREEGEGWNPGRRPARKPAAAPAAASGMHVEYEDSAERRGEFRLGQQVSCERFGVGEVRAFSGSGARMRVVVYFPKVGPQTLFAEYLRPVE